MPENNQTQPQTQGQAAAQQPQQQNQNQQPQQAPAIDYNKIQQMLDGTLAAKEDTALKAYFKQQGLSQQEAEQAMEAFKTQKAKNQPDVGAMQTQLASAQAAARKAQLESAAALAAIRLNVDPQTVPYLLKLADFSKAMDQDGKIDEKAMNEALSKVLEDVPALKPQAAGGNAGFRLGTGGDPAQQMQQGTKNSNNKPVATKRWNRWN